MDDTTTQAIQPTQPAAQPTPQPASQSALQPIGHDDGLVHDHGWACRERGGMTRH